MDQTEQLRKHVEKLLNWKDAHAGFDSAVKGIPAKLRGIRPDSLPYSLWEILEHLRLAQWDILEFCRNSEYEELNFPQDLWPGKPAPPSEDSWETSIAKFREDRKALQKIARDPKVDLFAKVPWGDGQTYLRELLLVADHNAYHTAELIAIRRVLGIWKP